MAKVGRYCKAYPVDRLRMFSSWSERIYSTRKEEKAASGGMNEVEVNQTEGDFLFIHDNYVVTDGIFLDENIVFDKVTPEWKSFCHDTLMFQPPQHIEAKETE